MIPKLRDYARIVSKETIEKIRGGGRAPRGKAYNACQFHICRGRSLRNTELYGDTFQ